MENKKNEENDVPKRTATDILLEMEAKINVLLEVARTQNLTISILSNRVLAIQESVKGNVIPKITVEAVAKRDYNFPEPIRKEDKPQGDRRTSRPETYSQSFSKIVDEKNKSTNASYIQSPDVIPKAEIINKEKNLNLISVKQKVIDKDNKSIFLADVNIINLEDSKITHNTRTNGAGNWAANLPLGPYRIKVSKVDTATRKLMEITQEIVIDAKQSPCEIATLCLRTNYNQ